MALDFENNKYDDEFEDSLKFLKNHKQFRLSRKRSC